jgi:NAD(P)-dependent dehydrogenase (short-subunit alcohol dehydrogenase family)
VDNQLKDKIAIVTGGGKGIGRGTALMLARRGAKVVLAGIRDESINVVKAEIEKEGGEAVTVRTDVSKWEDTQNMAKTTLDRYGRIDILVNNAGLDKINKTSKQYSVLDIDDTDWDWVLGVNLKGQFHSAKAVMPTMMAQKSGRIVNLSSTVAFNGAMASPAYCASKAGIIVLTKTLARELGPYNVRVNCVAPGMVLTPFHDYTPKEHQEMVSKMVALGRPAVADDIAQAILYFCQEDLFATGQTLVVDGGGTMR